MKKIFILLAFLFLLTGCGLLEFLEDGEPAEGRELVTVERVVDGDTVIVHLEDGSRERVRLLLIDTPESVKPDSEVQPFGEEASDFAKELMPEGETVELERGSPERDDYDRMLAYIWVEDENVNQLLVEEGYARVAFVYEPNTKYLEELEEAQEEAREKENNIWSIPGYVESRFNEY
ncbi:thermonuclease family protein [Oceanobacillus jeddahense]|uniref:Thermonuclease family protein n=1 Tax=Oceanobacillus jeddahense TaxID=1462527 RepID=A0ABY5JY03_9BACI|nr:thermonuclease family protein [Oceanobacillus jeddahense]UUI04675.1 thermonuclease family protein [Oceanobacillus jeddahense]